MDIDGGLGHRIVSHHVLNGGQGNVVKVHFGGKTVAEHPRCDVGFDAGFPGLIFDNALEPVV